MMNKEEVAKLSEPDPQLQQFLSNNVLPKADWNDVPAFRGMREQMEAQRLKELGPPGPHVEEEFKSIKMRDGFESKIKIHKPAGKSGGPLIVLIYGGGFVVGNYQQLTPYGRGFARAFDAVVVTISYRLAPEHKFPAAPNDVEDSLLWIAENAKALGADPSKGFVVGGISAGGAWNKALR